MEVLKQLIQSQEEYEDALRIEIDYENVRETKEGKRLLKWIRARRRFVSKMIKKFN